MREIKTNIHQESSSSFHKYLNIANLCLFAIYHKNSLISFSCLELKFAVEAELPSTFSKLSFNNNCLDWK